MLEIVASYQAKLLIIQHTYVKTCPKRERKQTRHPDEYIGSHLCNTVLRMATLPSSAHCCNTATLMGHSSLSSSGALLCRPPSALTMIGMTAHVPTLHNRQISWQSGWYLVRFSDALMETLVSSGTLTSTSCTEDLDLMTRSGLFADRWREVCMVVSQNNLTPSGRTTRGSSRCLPGEAASSGRPCPLQMPQ